MIRLNLKKYTYSASLLIEVQTIIQFVVVFFLISNHGTFISNLDIIVFVKFSQLKHTPKNTIS